MLTSCWVATLLAASLAAAPAPVRDVSPEAYRDWIVVVNYWASWCAPCRKELPLLAALQREYAARGVQIIGVSIDEPEHRQQAEKLAHRAGVDYPLRYDGTTAEMVQRKLGDAVPASLVLDRDGTAAFRMIGEIREAELRRRLEWLLGERAAPPPDELALPAGITAEHFREHHEAGESDEHDQEGAHGGKEGEEGGSAVPT